MAFVKVMMGGSCFGGFDLHRLLIFLLVIAVIFIFAGHGFC